MIDPKEAVQAFREKFSKMSHSQREQYLKDMGFSFGTERPTTRKKIASQYACSTIKGKVAGTRISAHKQSAFRKKVSGKRMVTVPMSTIKLKDE